MPPTDPTSQLWTIRVLADSVWDDLDPGAKKPYVVTQVDIPVALSEATATGASPVVDHDALPDAVYGLLAAVAGVGSTSAAGDSIDSLPTVEPKEGTTFGVVRDSFTLPATLLTQHTAVSGAGIPLGDLDGETLNAGTADALVGPCWPAIYAALGSAYLPDGYPVIEGLLNAVHLDHCVELLVPLEELANSRTIQVEAQTSPLEESASGRIVTVNLTLTSEGEVVARLVERFAIRGRVTSTQAPSLAPNWGGVDVEIVDTPRHFLRRAVVTAPADMTPFAMVSGDYNPIHTSTNAARLVGLEAPLVHGMWLSATAQHLATAGKRPSRLIGWTYSMFGMVQLNDAVDITVERIGRSARGAISAVEVTCRVDGNVVSRGQALLAPPTTAYVYPGRASKAPAWLRATVPPPLLPALCGSAPIPTPATTRILHRADRGREPDRPARGRNRVPPPQGRAVPDAVHAGGSGRGGLRPDRTPPRSRHHCARLPLRGTLPGRVHGTGIPGQHLRPGSRDRHCVLPRLRHALPG